jgi:hypothetical protein
VIAQDRTNERMTRMTTTQESYSSNKSSFGTKGKKKVRKVMHEFKSGALKSSSGSKVRNRKQAIAIALSEARSSGARIPAKIKSKPTK